MLQSEVAAFIHTNTSTYAGYESGKRDYYPLDKLSKIAELFNIELKNLLDKYNAFLYNNQGKQIKNLRTKKKMTQKEFAAYFGFHLWNIKQWETNKVRMSKRTWKKMFCLK